MQKVFNFLKNHVAHVATVDENGNPQTRPFGAVCIYDGKLCITTCGHKSVCKQLMQSGKIAISAMDDNSMDWFRFDGEAIPFTQDNDKAKAAMLAENPNLKMIYDNAPSVQLFWLKGTAKFVDIMGNAKETITL